MEAQTDPAALAVCEFWFGQHPDDAAAAEQMASLWWGHDDASDRDVERRFGSHLERAANGGLSFWKRTPKGRLALVLVLDQFSRMVYRGNARCFAQDERALGLAIEAVELGEDEVLRPIERLFLYLPFEHSESLAMQERSVELCRAMAESVPAAWRETFDGFTGFAVRHREIIERFGRFPHRNAILGRESTPEEIEFLKEPGSSF